MKSRSDLYFYPSSNWLRLHGYAMPRMGVYNHRKRRKRNTQREKVCLPFPDSKDLRKKRRFKMDKE